MKNIRILFFLLVINYSYSQTHTDELVDRDQKVYSWIIQKNQMVMNILFHRESQPNAETFTLTIEKDKFEKRPKFISINIPKDAVNENGIVLKFVNHEYTQGNIYKVKFDVCTDDNCSLTIKSAYLACENDNNKIDLLQKFLEYENLFVLFVDENRDNQYVSIPLESFKKDYEKLK